MRNTIIAAKVSPLVKTPEWQPHPDWWDIEQIFNSDTMAPHMIRQILLFTDSEESTIFKSSEIGGLPVYSGYTLYVTSDGGAYADPTSTGSYIHVWDKTKDKPCSLGYKTRYVIVYSLNENIKCNLDSYKSCIYCYIGGTYTKITSLQGNGANAISNANNILESIKVGHQVTCSANSINSSAFFNCTSLTSIIIPGGVTSIADSAFVFCYSLTSIIIPDSVTSIGNSAFQCCYSLNSIIIPDSVTSIGNGAFQGCSSLNSITIPASVTSIAGTAFYSCSSLTSITIPNGITNIGMNTFYGCYSLTSITIPNSVTNIGDSAFQNCYSLNSITIPSSVTSIGSSAFRSCSSLNSIAIPSSVTSIGLATFYSCYSLTSITIPGSVTSIADAAFQNCYSLTSVTIPNNVTSIVGAAFMNSSGLISINITQGWIGPAFSIANSPLSIGSLTNFINNLGSAPTPRTITIGADNLAKLTPIQIATATAKNYTLA